MSKKVLIIGGGPGGYVAALRAARAGAEVALVESGALGGTCLNRGCIPTKTLLHTVELYEEVKNRGPQIGLVASGLSVDWGGLMRRKGEVVARLVGGVAGLLKARGVLVVKGRAALLGPKEALVTRPDGQKEKIASDATIIATGSVPLKPPVPGFDLDGVITSDEALNLPKPPKSLVIVGGGVIGIELASVFAPLGADVTIVEALPEILPNIDPEIAAMMRAHLAGAGVKIHVGAGVEEVRREGGLFATTVKSEEKLSLQSEAVLIATGRGPNTRELGLEALGVEMSRARIKVDRAMATNLPGLYAIGDCASPIMLAHVASREGEVAADNAMGREASINYARVPGAVYTNPEIAWVGLSEKEAREKGLNIAVGRFPLDFNGKSLVMGGRGVFKTIIDASSGEVIGVHLMGPRATDIIGQAAVAMTLEARREDLAEVIAAHPTIGEALSESFLDAAGEAVHKI